ncbi:uncharacterized protein LOC105189438 [Harpegnathos saltator]|uniref:uncharacterized protein LOC105189438 n=1 Tax=Harpegnathos saltator TaxID=610380 RepID=UPI00058B8F4B|nr:uncharacterized protein LOC105189438 [Harpegnathos saltator]
MEYKLNNALLRYFKYVHTLYDEWLIINRTIETSLKIVDDQNEILRLISDDVTYNDIEIDEEQRQRLMFKILIVLDNELNSLFRIMSQFNYTIQDLMNHYDNVIQYRSRIYLADKEMIPLIMGSYCRPRLSLLMEWTTKSLEYFRKLYFCINNEIHNYNKENIADKVRAAINQINNRTSIKNILAYTQYMMKEEFLQPKHKNTGVQKIISNNIIE